MIISGQDDVSHARIELSSLNELYSGKLVHSITLISFEIFWIFRIHIHVCQVKTMCCMQEWLLTPCYPFGLSTFNELYRGKLVSSIIVNIPNLLAFKLSIISSNIYTRLAVCNCLSFILRSGICHLF